MKFFSILKIYFIFGFLHPLPSSINVSARSAKSFSFEFLSFTSIFLHTFLCEKMFPFVIFTIPSESKKQGRLFAFSDRIYRKKTRPEKKKTVLNLSTRVLVNVDPRSHAQKTGSVFSSVTGPLRPGVFSVPRAVPSVQNRVLMPRISFEGRTNGRRNAIRLLFRRFRRIFPTRVDFRGFSELY